MVLLYNTQTESYLSIWDRVLAKDGQTVTVKDFSLNTVTIKYDHLKRVDEVLPSFINSETFTDADL